MEPFGQGNTSTERSSSVMASRTLRQKGHASNSNSCKRVGESELLVSWVSEPSDNDLDPHGNLAKVDKEDVTTSKVSFRSREGSPPEKSLSKGQRTDKKEVDALPLLLSLEASPTWLVPPSGSADFAWSLFLPETQFPFLENLCESEEKLWAGFVEEESTD